MKSLLHLFHRGGEIFLGMASDFMKFFHTRVAGILIGDVIGDMLTEVTYLCYLIGIKFWLGGIHCRVEPFGCELRVERLSRVEAGPVVVR